MMRSSRRSSSYAPAAKGSISRPEQHAAGEESEGGSELEATAIADDLQKCRRLVASMRGLVLVTALRRQIVCDVEQAARGLILRQRQLVVDEAAVGHDSELLSMESPRQRYIK